MARPYTGIYRLYYKYSHQKWSGTVHIDNFFLVPTGVAGCQFFYVTKAMSLIHMSFTKGTMQEIELLKGIVRH